MAMSTCFFTSPTFPTLSNANPKINTPLFSASPTYSPFNLNLRLSLPSASISPRLSSFSIPCFSVEHQSLSVGGSDGNDNNNNNGGGDDHHGDGGGGDGEGNNKKEALMVLAEWKRSLESLPKDLSAAIEDGKIPAAVVTRFLELEKSPFMRWLLQFGGFKERLLADDLFLAKVFIECGVGMFTKTAAEYQRRKENFFNELEIVFSDVVMAVLADFMLVYLPAPTVSLRAPLSIGAGSLSRFFHGCPDNAFQVALSGSSYSFLQRMGAMMRNGAKLFAVGTTSSLVGTAVTNALIKARKAVDKTSAEEVEDLPILSTSVAYGVYMAVSSNLRYQILAGVIEQRVLEPVLHHHKLLLSAICFAVRTGNTFLGSLLWVDYARLIGIQKAPEENKALA